MQNDHDTEIRGFVWLLTVSVRNFPLLFFLQFLKMTQIRTCMSSRPNCMYEKRDIDDNMCQDDGRSHIYIDGWQTVLSEKCLHNIKRMLTRQETQTPLGRIRVITYTVDQSSSFQKKNMKYSFSFYLIISAPYQIKDPYFSIPFNTFSITTRTSFHNTLTLSNTVNKNSVCLPLKFSWDDLVSSFCLFIFSRIKEGESRGVKCEPKLCSSFLHVFGQRHKIRNITIKCVACSCQL